MLKGKSNGPACGVGGAFVGGISIVRWNGVEAIIEKLSCWINQVVIICVEYLVLYNGGL